VALKAIKTPSVGEKPEQGRAWVRSDLSIPHAPDPRVAEIGEILALGLVRLRTRESSQIADARGDSSLACVAHQSSGANSETENAE
jgi:hypothetical protein